MTSFFRLFRFADKTDKTLIIFGILGTIIMGLEMPIFNLLWGNMTNVFDESDDVLVDQARTLMFEFFGVGFGVFIGAWLMYSCWIIAG